LLPSESPFTGSGLLDLSDPLPIHPLKKIGSPRPIFSARVLQFPYSP
jgi:hypothetical protein